MFVLSKFKFIAKLAKKTGESLANNTILLSNNASSFSTSTNKTALELEKELQRKIKEEKKLKMKDVCKPSLKNIEIRKFKKKDKYINMTPKGEKKGISFS